MQGLGFPQCLSCTSKGLPVTLRSRAKDGPSLATLLVGDGQHHAPIFPGLELRLDLGWRHNLRAEGALC